jgi:quinol monooxygenase YgiN
MYQSIHNYHKECTVVKKLVLVAAMTLCLAVGLSAQEGMKAATHGGKVTVIVTHEVKDYAVWRKGYDADQPNRQKAGFKVSGVYVDVKNPNLVSVIGEFPSAAAAEAFTASPKLKDVMEKAGVIGKPEVKVLTRAPK